MNYFFLIIALLISKPLFACISSKDIEIYKDPIAKDMIYNGVSVNIFNFSVKNCGLECYLNYLALKNIGFILNDKVLDVQYNQGFTMQIFNSFESEFNGRMICKGSKKLSLVALPTYLKIGQSVSDIQTFDNNYISRTLVFNKISSSRYQSLVTIISKNSIEKDINKSFSYFKTSKGEEVYLSYNQNISFLTIVYNKPIKR